MKTLEDLQACIDAINDELYTVRINRRELAMLDHAEFVVVGGVQKFAERHADLPFTDKERTINPELSLKTGTLSIKFHEQPLGAVVRIEQRLGKEEK